MADSYNRGAELHPWYGYHLEVMVDSYEGGQPALDSTTALWGIPTSLNANAFAELQRKHVIEGSLSEIYMASGFILRGDRDMSPRGLARQNTVRAKAMADKLKAFLEPKASEIRLFAQWHTVAPEWKTTQKRGKGVLSIGPGYAANPQAALASFAPGGTLENVPLWEARIEDLVTAMIAEIKHQEELFGIKTRYVSPFNEAANGAGADYGTCHPVTGPTYARVYTRLKALMKADPHFAGHSLRFGADSWLGAWGENNGVLAPEDVSLWHKIGVTWENSDYARNNNFRGSCEEAFQNEYEGLGGVHPNGPEFQVANNILKTLNCIYRQKARSDNHILHFGKPDHLADTNSGPNAYAAYGFNITTGAATPSYNYWGLRFVDRMKRNSKVIAYTVDGSLPWSSNRIALLYPDGRVGLFYVNRTTAPMTVSVTTDCAMTGDRYAYQVEKQAMPAIPGAGTHTITIPPMSGVVYEQVGASTPGGGGTNPDPDPDPNTEGNMYKVTVTVRPTGAGGTITASCRGYGIGGGKAVPFDAADPSKTYDIVWTIDPALVPQPVALNSLNKIEIKNPVGADFDVLKVQLQEVSQTVWKDAAGNVITPRCGGAVLSFLTPKEAVWPKPDATAPVITVPAGLSMVENKPYTFQATGSEPGVWRVEEAHGGDLASGATVDANGLVTVPAKDFEKVQEVVVGLVLRDAAGNEGALQVVIPVTNDASDDGWVATPAAGAGQVQWTGVNLEGADFSMKQTGDATGYGEIGGTYGTDYRYPVDAELDDAKANGVKLVRLPYRWERVQNHLNGELQPKNLAEIKRIAANCKALGLKVVFDMHNYWRRDVIVDADPATPNKFGQQIGGLNSLVSIAHYVDFYTKFSAALAEYGSAVGYDLMNEPNGLTPDPAVAASGDELLAKGYKAAADAVLANHPDAFMIAMEPSNWGKITSLVSLVRQYRKLQPVRRPMEVFEFHQYSDAATATTAAESGGGTTAISPDPQWLVTRIRPVVEWARGNGERLWFGEFGIAKGGPLTAHNKIVNAGLNFCNASSDVVIATTAWGGGRRFGPNYIYTCNPYETEGGFGAVWPLSVTKSLRPHWGLAPRVVV
jgi:aryl-phospho-beta-D-glucosidase BglC (GH1 family)